MRGRTFELSAGLRSNYAPAHAFELCAGPHVRAMRRPTGSVCAPARAFGLRLVEVFLLAAVSPGLHLHMQIRSSRRALGGASAAVPAAIGRMLLTSAIMKSQAQFRYTEYPDMFG